MASTLNKNLPKVSLIAFYSNVSQGTRFTKGFTDELGKFTVTIGMRQPTNKAFPYQVQYRWHWRYTLANQQKKGAAWTAWTAWQNPIAVSGLPKGSTTDPNNWQKSNLGKGSTSYVQVFKYTNCAMDAAFDAFCVQFRVRTYDASKRKHGEWVSSGDLLLYRRAQVLDETLVKPSASEIDIDFNYKWDRGRTLYIKSLKNASGTELLKRQVDVTPAVDSARGVLTDCPKRSGYIAGTYKLKVGTHLHSVPDAGTQVTIDAWLQTADGAQTKFDSPKMLISGDADLAKPTINITSSQSGGITVRVYKGDATDDYYSAGINMTYLNKRTGHMVSISPDYEKYTENVMDTTTPIITARYIHAPVNVELRVTASIRNRYKKVAYSNPVTRTVDMGGYSVLTWAGDTYGDATYYAQALGDLGISFSTKRDMQVEVTGISGQPFVVFGKKKKTNISLSFSINDEVKTDYAGYAKWNQIREHPGMYCLKLYDGQVYNLAIEKVSISAESRRQRKVSIEAVEV